MFLSNDELGGMRTSGIYRRVGALSRKQARSGHPSLTSGLSRCRSPARRVLDVGKGLTFPNVSGQEGAFRT